MGSYGMFPGRIRVVLLLQGSLYVLFCEFDLLEQSLLRQETLQRSLYRVQHKIGRKICQIFCTILCNVTTAQNVLWLYSLRPGVFA